MLEVRATSAVECEAWELAVRRMLQALDWPDPAVLADRYASGASLAFTAPLDQLLAATEVNEWAWQSVAVGGMAAPLPFTHAPGHPAAWDFESALRTLRHFAAAEAKPRAMMLLAVAAQHGLPVFIDDDAVSIGAGEGSQCWPLDALPGNLADVDWTGLHDVPTVLVTGSNGKTTTVRLLSAMFAAAGMRPGFNCTDGIFIAGQEVASGDYSGPAGARQVLRDVRVQAAVLETARGGILRRGLAVRHAHAALITNVSADHFGEYGVHGLADLADAKLVLARAIAADGVLVLNADDPLLVEKSAGVSCPVAWFSLDDGQPLLRAARECGGATCGVDDGRLRLQLHGVGHDLGDVAAMPLTVSGSARYNTANVAGAALVAGLLGIAPTTIAGVLTSFGAHREDNPGRLERWTFSGASILLDYAHNPDGLCGLLEVAGRLREASGGRMGLLLGQAGNRDDEAIAELARTAAAAAPDMVVLKDLEGYMRGRVAGEVPGLLHAELLRQGIPAQGLRTILGEVEAAQSLLSWAQPADVLVLPVHNLAARATLIAWLRAQGARSG